MNRIYLDHNATSIIDDEVIEFIKDISKLPVNASSIHSYGRFAKGIIEDTRANVFELLGVERRSRYHHLYFASGGTEANNTVLQTYNRDDAEIFISSIEHVSVLDAKKYYKNVKLIKTCPNGIVDLDDLEKLLYNSFASQKLVSVMLANNETGIIQPILEISQIAKKYGAKLHSDCVAAVGKIGVNIFDLNLDYATISGHKFGASIGVGCIIAKQDAKLEPILRGGGQERGMRSGTENVLSIGSLGILAKKIQKMLVNYNSYMKNIQNVLENSLSKFGVLIVGSDVDRLPNTTLILKKGLEASTLMMLFDLRGVAVSSGSACSSGKIGKSHVLKAMNIEDDYAKSAIRVSTFKEQNISDIKKFIEICGEIYV
jgi:cysteine desulfurase